MNRHSARSNQSRNQDVRHLANVGYCVAICTMFSIVLGYAQPLMGQEDQTVLLIDGRQSGETFSVRSTLQVAGKLKAPSDAAQDVTTSATAQVQYLETVLYRDDVQIRTVRQYSATAAELRAAAHQEKSSLAEQRSAISASCQNKQFELVSTAGNMTRSELDAITFPGDHLVAYRLLPGKQVHVGEQWSHTEDNLALLLQLDHVGTNEVKSRLLKVENGLAIIQTTGEIRGRASGVGTSMRLTGECRYDLRWNRVNWLHLRISETREASAQSPGFSVDAEMKMLVQPAPPASGKAMAEASREVTHRDRLLRYDSQTAGFEVLHPRRWHVIDERARHSTWRVIDGDDWIAQCNVIRLKDLPQGKQISLEEFQADIQKALGKQFAEFESAIRKQRKDGYDVLRVAAAGIVAEIPVRWIYYHVTNPTGQRVNLVFVMDRENAQKLESDDVTAVSSITLTIRSSSLPSVPDDEAGAPAIPPKSTAETARGGSAGVRQ